MDAANYCMFRFQEIQSKLHSFLGKLGYNLDKVPFVPISGFEGDNLIERSTNLDWYKGPTLLEALDRIKLPLSARLFLNPLRIPLHGVYKIGGIGNVPVGRVVTGHLKPGMAVTFAPTGLQDVVESVQMEGEAVPIAFPGDYVGLDCKNIAAGDLKPGYVASDSIDDPAMEATHFTSHVIITNEPGLIRNGYTPVLDCHTSHVAVMFAELIAKVDGFYGKEIEKEPEFLKSGDAAVIKMIPTKPMVVEDFSQYPPLGRFVARDRRQTVAFGVITSVERKITESAWKKPFCCQRQASNCGFWRRHLCGEEDH
jgi:elongation factor 1-alpha